MTLIQQVAGVDDQWAAHFKPLGVCPADMAQLAASIDRDPLKLQKQAFL